VLNRIQSKFLLKRTQVSQKYSFFFYFFILVSSACFGLPHSVPVKVCFGTNKNDVVLNLFLYICPHSFECEIVLLIPYLFVSVFLSLFVLGLVLTLVW